MFASHFKTKKIKKNKNCFCIFIDKKKSFPNYIINSART